MTESPEGIMNRPSPSPSPILDPASPVSTEDVSELIQSLGRLPAVEHTEFVPIDDAMPVWPLCSGSEPRLHVGNFNDLFNINHTNDSVHSTSETKDGLRSTSETKDGLRSTSETKDGVHSTSETKDGLHSTSEIKDGLRSTSETKDGLHSTSETKDGVHSTFGDDGLTEVYLYGGVFFLGGETSARQPVIDCPCCDLDVKPATEVRRAVQPATVVRRAAKTEVRHALQPARHAVQPAEEVRSSSDLPLKRDTAGDFGSNISSPNTIVHEDSDDEVAYGEYRDLMSVMPNAARVVPIGSKETSVKQGIRLQGHVLPLYHHGTVSPVTAAHLLATSQIAVPQTGDAFVPSTFNQRIHLHRGTIRLPGGRYLAKFRSEDRQVAAMVPFQVSHNQVSPIHVPCPYPSNMQAADIGLSIQAKAGRQAGPPPEDGVEELPKQKRRDIVVSVLRAQGQPNDVTIHSLFRKWTLNFARHPLPHYTPLWFTLRNAFPPDQTNGGVVAGVKQHFRLKAVVVDTANDIPPDACVAFDAETVPNVVRLLVWSHRLPKGGVKCRIKGLSEFYLAEHGWDEARECRWFQFRQLGMSNDTWIRSHPMTDMTSPDVYVENLAANHANGCYAERLHFKLWDAKEPVTHIYVGITEVKTRRALGEFHGAKRNLLVPAKTREGTAVLNENGSIVYTRVSRWLLSGGRLLDPHDGYFAFGARSTDDDLHVEVYSWDKELLQANAHIVTIIPYETEADPVPTLGKEYEVVRGDQKLQIAADVDTATVPVTAERITVTPQRRHSSRTLVRQTPGKGVFFDGAAKLAVEDPAMRKTVPLYFPDVNEPDV